MNTRQPPWHIQAWDFIRVRMPYSRPNRLRLGLGKFKALPKCYRYGEQRRYGITYHWLGLTVRLSTTRKENEHG